MPKVLAPTGYSAAQLAEGGAEHAKWAAIADGLIQRAEQRISIMPKLAVPISAV